MTSYTRVRRFSPELAAELERQDREWWKAWEKREEAAWWAAWAAAPPRTSEWEPSVPLEVHVEGTKEVQ